MSGIRKKDICRGCGIEVVFIKCVNGKTITAETEPVWIRPDIHGDAFVTEDGRFFWGVITGDAYDDPGGGPLQCYEPHKGKCPGGGRKRRK